MLIQKYNIAMFGSFSHLQEFLKKQGLLFEADLCDLLNEVFHLAYTHFFQKTSSIFRREVRKDTLVKIKS